MSDTNERDTVAANLWRHHLANAALRLSGEKTPGKQGSIAAARIFHFSS